MRSFAKLHRRRSPRAVLIAARARASRSRSSSGRTSTRRREPYHKWSVWAADEIKKRTNGRIDIEVFPASTPRQGDRHQPGPDARHGRHDHHRRVVRRAHAIRALGVALLPVHLPRRRSPDRSTRRATSFKEMAKEYRKKTGIQITAITYYGARHDHVATSRSPTAPGMKGLKIRVPDVPAYLALPKALRREPDADRLRRGLSRAAERHRRRAGESADDDRGEEVLRSAEGHHR